MFNPIMSADLMSVKSEMLRIYGLLDEAVTALGYDDQGAGAAAKLLEAGVADEERVERFLGLSEKGRNRAVSALKKLLEGYLDQIELHDWAEETPAVLAVNSESKGALFRYALSVNGAVVTPRVYDPYVPCADGRTWEQVQRDAETDGKYVVRTGRDFQRLRPRFNKKVGTAISFTHLVQNENELVFHPLVKPSPVTAETALLEGTAHTERVWVDSHFKDEVENYSYAFLYLQVQNGDTLGYFAGDEMKIYRFIKRENGVMKGDAFYVPTSDKVMLNLRTGATFKWEGSAKEGWEVLTYTPEYATSTPGQEKKGEVTLICDNLPGFDARAHVNHMTHGAYDILAKHYAGKDLSTKKKVMAQLATRMSQYKAPMIDGKPMHVFGIVLDKIHDLKGNEFMDGLGWVTAEFAAEFFTDENFVVMPSAVDGAGEQGRQNHMCKGFDHIRPCAHIVDDLEEVLKVRFELVFQDQPTIQGDQKDLETRILDGEGSGTRFDKKEDGRPVCVLVCEHKYDPEDGHEYTLDELLMQLSSAVDLNVFKTICDFTIPMTGLAVMDIAHEKEDLEDEVNTSNQLLDSPAWFDAEGTKAFCVNKTGRAMEGKLSSLMEDEEKTPHPSELAGDLGMLEQSVFPDWVQNCWAPSFQTRVEKTLEGVEHRIAKLAVSTDGLYGKLIPDFGHLKGLDLISYDPETGVCEVFAPGLEAFGVRDAVMLKYPKQGTDEFLRAHVVYREELVARVAAKYQKGEISFEMFRQLRHEIRHLQGGIFMVPAVPELMNLLAGMDFDGDAAMAYIDKDLIRLYDGIKPCATVICKEDEMIALGKKLHSRKLQRVADEEDLF